MTRDEFEHLLRAAADVVKDELVLVGSQAVLGGFPDAPVPLLRSLEVDVYPRSDPDRAAEIDGAIGDGSPFHATYGYYAHGVGPERIQAPAGWEGRLVRLELPGFRRTDPPVVAWYLEIHDLVLAKLAARREHDVVFAEEAIREGLVDVENLRRGVELMTDPVRTEVAERLDALVAKIGRDGRVYGADASGA